MLLDVERLRDSLNQSPDGFNYFFLDNLFSPQFIQLMQTTTLEIFKSGQFKSASIGPAKTINQNIRSDSIYWINHEANEFPQLKENLKIIIEICRSELRLGLKSFESHLAYYPIHGKYEKHCDVSPKKPGRLLTLVIYLSEYKNGLGGELVLYPNEREVIKIQPLKGRLTIFDSQIQHEVLPSYHDRLSITSWFYGSSLIFP